MLFVGALSTSPPTAADASLFPYAHSHTHTQTRARQKIIIGGVFEPDREDNMPRMPPSDIHLQSPRQWSPISYAFLGDAVWELYIRRLFFAPPSRPLEYDLKCKRAVKAEAQDAVLRQLVDAEFFSDDELGIVKWGRNASYGNTPQRRGRVVHFISCFVYITFPFHPFVLCSLDFIIF